MAIKRPEKTTSSNPSPKWLEGDYHENSKQSKKHEQRLAERLGGKRYSGSGNRKWSKWARSDQTDKGDIATPKLHLEHKFTRNQSLSVKTEWLAKVREGARAHLKDPGLVVTFQDQRGHLLDEWVMVPLDVFERLMQKAEAADGAGL